MSRSPSGTSYPQLPGGGIDTEAVRRQLQTKAKVVESENLFEVLGLQPTAGREEIKNAYFEAARRYHPDRLGPLGLEGLRSEVEKVFRRVSEAYSTLYDDAQREAYREAMNKPRTAGDAEAHAKAMKMLEAEMAFRRGEIAMRKNDFQGALPELEAAVKANPTEGEHVAYMIWVKLCLGQLNHTQARPQFQEAVKLSPKCARAYYFLGVCMKEEHEIDKAYNAFRKANELDPRMLDAEREMRLINMRREKSSKSGLLSKLLSKK
jgi:tetratricopeptide (TPR) repeat protein